MFAHKAKSLDRNSEEASLVVKVNAARTARDEALKHRDQCSALHSQLELNRDGLPSDDAIIRKHAEDETVASIKVTIAEKALARAQETLHADEAELDDARRHWAFARGQETRAALVARFHAEFSEPLRLARRFMLEAAGFEKDRALANSRIPQGEKPIFNVFEFTDFVLFRDKARLEISLIAFDGRAARQAWQGDDDTEPHGV